MAMPEAGMHHITLINSALHELSSMCQSGTADNMAQSPPSSPLDTAEMADVGRARTGFTGPTSEPSRYR